MEGVAASLTLKPFSVSVDPLSVGSRWKKWKRSFTYYVDGRGITNPGRKMALLMDCAGEEVQDIYDTLTADDGADVYEKAVNALDAYFTPKTNVPYERSMFRRTEMNEGETVASYVTRLRRLAVTCEFNDDDDMIRDQVIEKVKSDRLRKKLLEKGSDLKLTDVLTISSTEEAVSTQSQNIVSSSNGSSTSTVNRVYAHNQRHRSKPKQPKPGGNSNPRPSNADKTSKVCYRCKSSKHIASSKDCPARGKECRKCHKTGHFEGSKFCNKSSSANAVTEQTVPLSVSDGDEPLYEYAVTDNMDISTYTTLPDTLSVRTSEKSTPKVKLFINRTEVCTLIDSGASCNLMDKSTADRVGLQISKTDKRLFSYGSTKPLDLVGQAKATVFVPCNGKKTEALFFLFNGNAPTLLSKSTAEHLDLLRVGPVKGDVAGCGAVNAVGVGAAVWRNRYPECFSGVGKLKDFQVSLHIDSSVKPIAQPVRRMPFGHREPTRAKLDELLSLDIIEKVEGPTRWLSPIVTVPKDNGDVRLCIDMRQANKAIVRERHPIPTVKELLYNLNGAKVFSKLDLKLGFHQLELDDASRDITTFVTPFGLFRYKRLMFGIASAPEVYQYQLQKVISGLAGCQNYADDIIVYGKNQSEHDDRLSALLERLKTVGLTLNPEKCEFSLECISYVGYEISAEGVSVSKSKVKSIVETRVPKDVTELRSFLGLVNFVGRFVPDLSTVAEPLSKLTRTGEKFVWGKSQKLAFESVKKLMSDCKTLAFFDPNAKTTVTADASPYGLGAVLSQKVDGIERVVAYGHRSLTNVERRYSQTEREALAIVWSCEYFYIYLMGLKFTLITDHKPLQFIFNRTNSKPSPRVERWVLRLQAFDYEVVYKPGPQNIADSLSRLSVSTGTCSAYKPNIAEAYVHVVAEQAVPNAMSYRDIKLQSMECSELGIVKTALLSGDWSRVLPSYRAVRFELSDYDGLLLRGNRIVMPVSLRESAVKLAHEGHQGISKTKQRLRSKVWWPSMDKEAERLCRACFECQLVSSPSKPEPIVSTRLPDKPWDHLACDLLGPLPNGQSILVIVDYYSRFFEVAFLRSTVSANVVSACEDVIARWGVPPSLRSDNGPQFASKEFQNFLQEYGIQWRSTTPLWPQANGEVERQNRSLLKSLKIAQLSKRDYRAELRKFLLAYRSTPHSVTGVSPSELMLGRTIRTKLPSVDRITVSSSESHRNDEAIRDRQSLSQVKSEDRVNENRSKSEVGVGDRVLVRSKDQGKLSPTFSSSEVKVAAKEGSEVVVQDGEGSLSRRNITEVKPIALSKPARNCGPPVRFGESVTH
jgi:hypothetical protein